MKIDLFLLSLGITLAGMAVFMLGIAVGIVISRHQKKPDSHSEIPFDLPHKDHSDRKF